MRVHIIDHKHNSTFIENVKFVHCGKLSIVEEGDKEILYSAKKVEMARIKLEVE